MQPLEIIVTGNADGAKSTLQSVQAELGKTALAAQKTDSAIDVFGKTMARFGSQGSASIALLTGKIEALKAEMVNIKDISVLAKFNQEIEASELQLGKMSNAGKTGFNDLGEAIAKTGNPLSHGYGILRKIAYVLPGIGISGIVAFATEPIINFVEQLINANKGIDEVKLNLNNINEVMTEANKKAAEQITDLKLLYEAATNVNLSMKDRLAAVKALQKEFPDYFGNIDKESILNGTAKKSYDDLTTAIIANARAQAAHDKIVKLEDQKLDAEQAKQNKINASNQANQDLVAGKNKNSFASGLVSESGNDYVTSLSAQIAANNLATADYIKKQDENIKSINDQEDHLKNFVGIANLTKTTKGATDDGHTKKTNPFEISLKDLEDNYKKAQALLVSQYDANTTDAKKNTTAINDLLLKAQADFLEKKLALIKKYGKKEGETDLEIAKVNKALIANQVGFNIDQINTLPKVQGAPNINFKKATTEKIGTKPDFQFSDAIKKNIKAQQEMFELLTNTATLLDKTVGPAFDTLFTNILDGSGNAFKAFGDSIKQMLVQLGEAVLKAALFSAILSVISGGANNALGAAHGGKSFMDLFGPAMKGIFGFSNGGAVKGYATGGVISGPGTSTSDSILARLSRGEYIINAAAVSKFGSSFFDSINSGMLPKFNRGGNIGSAQLVTSQSAIDHYFHGEIAGDKLLLLHDRATARRGRNG